ncbi:Microtubule Organization Protein Akna [Manis pentadactyla]|nr:Microtubule Organization Protein Akna [Manis pentadactyla]
MPTYGFRGLVAASVYDVRWKSPGLAANAARELWAAAEPGGCRAQRRGKAAVREAKRGSPASPHSGSGLGEESATPGTARRLPAPSVKDDDSS